MSAGAALVLGLLFVAVVIITIQRDENDRLGVLLLAAAVAGLLVALALNLWGQR